MMILIERLVRPLSILLLVHKTLIMCQATIADLSVNIAKGFVPNGSHLSGNDRSSLGRLGSVSFSTSEASTKGLSHSFVARPRGMIQRKKMGAVFAVENGSEFPFGSWSKTELVDDPEKAQEEIKAVAKLAIKPYIQHKDSHKFNEFTKSDALDMIISYVKKFELKNPKVIREGLEALREFLRAEPATENDVQKTVDIIFSSNFLSGTSKRVYLDIIQEEARMFFSKFSRGQFQHEHKIDNPAQPMSFWKGFVTQQSTEEELAEGMLEVLESRLKQYSTQSHFDRTWKSWIRIFFPVVLNAQSTKLDMFDMLYIFAHQKSEQVIEGVPLLILTEDKILAHEACRSLAAKSEVLGKRYGIWLERDARRKLSEIPPSMVENPELFQAYNDLITDKLHSNTNILLAKLERSVRNAIHDLNTWTDSFESTVQVLFVYGKVLMRKDPDHLENPQYHTVLKILEALSSPKGTLEKRVLAFEAFKQLRSMSGGKSDEDNFSLSFSWLSHDLNIYEMNTNLIFARASRSVKYQVEEDGDDAYFLNKIRDYETPDMLEIINKLVNPEIEMTRDQQYIILDQIKSLASTTKPNILENVNEPCIFTHSNWRHTFLLNLIAAKSLKDKSDFWILNHILGDLEDLSHSTSTVVYKLAKISIKAIRTHTKGILPNLNEFQYLERVD
ncbi:hypothetical protein CROQUDRAFT_273585 [Cronartium quercuum f. sp. fusiforme G11]|uniref:Uncharacterized protein n=1 Tax=Cronartium quercuum f. sp. fusiforme G11 TaxID=708437 RepID=A0A9P6NUL3_9BASI|nr:hypothetical protein CROQUDRAFT_273585 [Cronartium quercuum f. sp. fusiforme G11]